MYVCVCVCVCMYVRVCMYVGVCVCFRCSYVKHPKAGIIPTVCRARAMLARVVSGWFLISLARSGMAVCRA